VYIQDNNIQSGLVIPLISRGAGLGILILAKDELFNIAQEALNNSLKHARAESVRVLIEEDQGKITLSIEDDGVSFNTSAKHPGMGLRNMLERADSITGELTIHSQAEHGTRVTISVEVHKEK
jgi:signal transduction histidine kinase